MRVLITGGAGFIGSHLCEAYLERGDEVLVLDDLSTGSIDNIRHLRGHPRFHYTLDSVHNHLVVAELVVHLRMRRLPVQFLARDLIRDPELTFAWPAWMPTSITQDPVGRYVEAFVEVNGKTQVRPLLLRELQVFANAWARNLRAQGFTGPDVVASSLTHPLPAKT